MRVSMMTIAAGAWVSYSPTNFTQSALFHSLFHHTLFVGKGQVQRILNRYGLMAIASPE